MTLVIIGVAAGYGWLRYGSIRTALGATEGAPLLVDRPFRKLAGIRPGERVAVSYTLTNASDRPITLLGMKSSCSCTVMDGLPITLAVAMSRTITASVSTEGSRSGLFGSMQLFTDHPDAAVMALDYQIRFESTSTDGGSPRER